jgi:hypothetical protein
MLQMLPRARGASRHFSPSFLLSHSHAPRARGNICNIGRSEVAMTRRRAGGLPAPTGGLPSSVDAAHRQASKKIVVQRRNVVLHWPIRDWYHPGIATPACHPNEVCQDAQRSEPGGAVESLASWDRDRSGVEFLPLRNWRMGGACPTLSNYGPLIRSSAGP